jgi:hypothetical protein
MGSITTRLPKGFSEIDISASYDWIEKVVSNLWSEISHYQDLRSWQVLGVFERA